MIRPKNQPAARLRKSLYKAYKYKLWLPLINKTTVLHQTNLQQMKLTKNVVELIYLVEIVKIFVLFVLWPTSRLRSKFESQVQTANTLTRLDRKGVLQPLHRRQQLTTVSFQLHKSLQLRYPIKAYWCRSTKSLPLHSQ